MNFMNKKITRKEILYCIKMKEDAAFEDNNGAMELVCTPTMWNRVKHNVINQHNFIQHSGKINLIIEGVQEAKQQPNTIKENFHYLSFLFIEEDSDELVGHNRSEDEHLVTPLR